MSLFDELKGLTSPGTQAKPAPPAVVETPAQSAIPSSVSESAPTTTTVPAESVTASPLPVVDVMSQADIDAAMKQAVLVVPAHVSPEPTAVSSAPDGEGMTPRELDAARKLAARQAVLAQVVPVLPEPVVALSIPDGAEPLYTKKGVLAAYRKSDGAVVAVTEEPISLLDGLSEADRAPVDPESEARLDLSPRTAGRIAYLAATFEAGHPERTAARQQSDLGRALYQKSLTAKPFDPEKSANADKIKRFLQ